MCDGSANSTFSCLLSFSLTALSVHYDTPNIIAHPVVIWYHFTLLLLVHEPRRLFFSLSIFRLGNHDSFTITWSVHLRFKRRIKLCTTSLPSTTTSSPPQLFFKKSSRRCVGLGLSMGELPSLEQFISQTHFHSGGSLSSHGIKPEFICHSICPEVSSLLLFIYLFSRRFFLNTISLVSTREVRKCELLCRRDAIIINIWLQGSRSCRRWERFSQQGDADKWLDPSPAAFSPCFLEPKHLSSIFHRFSFTTLNLSLVFLHRVGEAERPAPMPA